MADAAYLVVPSRFFEGYPLVVAEAFGRARPVLTVSGGSVGTIVDKTTGWVVEPTPDALANAMRQIDDEEATERGTTARQTYEAQNTPQRGLASLIEVYSSLIDGT